MKDIIEIFNGGPLLNFLFFCIAVISLIITFIFYVKSKREKKLVYVTKSFGLIQDSISSIDNLSIKYNDEDVKSLTLTQISFWNDGRDTIKSDDVAKSDTLKVKLNDECKVYSAKLTKTQKETNEISIETENNQVYIMFSYLDYSDGAILDIYHSGNPSDEVKIVGTIIGGLEISLAEKEEFYIVNPVGNILFPSYWEQDFSSFGILDKILCAVLTPLAFIITALLMPIEIFTKKFITTIPKEFMLSGLNSHKALSDREK
jgi:hypothetical protein